MRVAIDPKASNTPLVPLRPGQWHEALVDQFRHIPGDRHGKICHRDGRPRGLVVTQIFPEQILLPWNWHQAEWIGMNMSEYERMWMNMNKHKSEWIEWHEWMWMNMSEYQWIGYPQQTTTAKTSQNIETLRNSPKSRIGAPLSQEIAQVWKKTLRKRRDI